MNLCYDYCKIFCPVFPMASSLSHGSDFQYLFTLL